MRNRELIKALKDRGWTYCTTGGNHMKFTHTKSGDFVIHASTSSDHRAIKNLMSRVKRIEREFEEKQQQHLIAAE